jgi:prolyl oligopeptidase
MTFGAEGDLILVSRNGAPRGRLLRIPLSSPALDRARTIVAESDLVIESDFWESGPSPVVTPAGIYVPYQAGGPMEIRVFGPDGAARGGPELPPFSGVYEMTAIGDDLALVASSYTSSTAWYRYSVTEGRTVRTPLVNPAPIGFDDAEVVRKFATSKDGTEVPYVIMRPRGTAGQNIPMIVTGYGGYGNSTTPSFNRMNRLLLDRGIGMVQTFLRGGGEFGETWHENGRLTKKQNVFDDFAAVLRQLAADGDSSPDRLGIIGGSNGGLLMGATFTQHPELARAVVSAVGIYDMLRVELAPNGTFNIPEFGTVADAAQFAALHAYSPYHHVRDGTAYPSILFMTGANDPRVDPMHSRKMTARLQASGTERPVLLRTSGSTGHGAGTPLDARIDEDTDIYSFLFHEIGQ